MSYLTEYTYPSAYHLGRADRYNGKQRSAPANLTFCERHWWLAGWNDTDIEIGDKAS